MTPLVGANDKFCGFTNVERAPNGMLMLEKTVDFSHPKAPEWRYYTSRSHTRGIVSPEER